MRLAAAKDPKSQDAQKGIWRVQIETSYLIKTLGKPVKPDSY
jgi:hypothetical protein